MKNVLWFDEIGMTDLPAVGGKNASLGEMVSHLSALGVRVPGGFATTADAYRRTEGQALSCPNPNLRDRRSQATSLHKND